MAFELLRAVRGGVLGQDPVARAGADGQTLGLGQVSRVRQHVGGRARQQDLGAGGESDSA